MDNAGSDLATWSMTWIPEAERVTPFFTQILLGVNCAVLNFKFKDQDKQTQVKVNYSITLQGHTYTLKQPGLESRRYRIYSSITRQIA